MRDKISNVKKKMKMPKHEVGHGYPSHTEHDNALTSHTCGVGVIDAKR